MDTFIKPPVSIYIVFNQEIRLDSILIDAKVNSQISNGFIVSTSIEQPSLLQMLIKENKLTNTTFQQVGKIINEKNKQLHIYEFVRRLSHYNSTLNSNLVYFSSRMNSYLDRISGISICITRTLNSSSACLRSIKVFGNIVQQSNDSILNATTNNKRKKQEITTTVEIPNEFIDELTHEIMKMPIRLPSKKFIDNSTLDKYLNEQKSKNEIAKDPFTCIPFSNNYKPIIEEELKSKIDIFLLNNQNNQLIYKSEKKSPSCEPNQKLNLVSKEIFVSKDNLDDEDYKTMKNSPVTSPCKATISKRLKSSVSCRLCLNLKNPSVAFYELELCKHVYCRNCLLTMSKKCVVCKTEFSTSQIINLDRTFLNK